MAQKDLPHDVERLRKLELKAANLAQQLASEKRLRVAAEHDLSKAQERIALYQETQDRFRPKGIRRGKQSKGEATAILAWNDWHLEERVEPESIDYANEYNLDIAARRIKRLYDKQVYLLDFARQISDIRDVVIWLGGDLINGHIHEEMAESNFCSPAEAILHVQDHVATGIDFLLKEAKLNSITVVTSYGNHGRTTARRRVSTGYGHSWEWAAYNNLSRLYRHNPKVQWKITRGYHNWLTIQGHDVRFHHGDSVRYGGGIGGVMIPLRKKIAQWNKWRRAHLDVIGHFHQFVDSWDAVVCGCLVGYNAYAVEIGAEFERPTQTMIVVDKKYGKILSIPVFVEDEHASRPK